MDLRYVADTSSKQLFCGREMSQENCCYVVEYSTCSTTSVHRCLHRMIEKLCDTMCVVFSTMWLLCPKLVETSLSHFSRQSLQQVVLSSNFGRDVNNTSGATTEPTNHLPHLNKNKTVNQTKIGTLYGKRTKDQLCKRCQQHQRSNH